VARALADGWGLTAPTLRLRYAPVGGGSYHWAVTAGRAGRWFVTVDDLDDKGWLGRTSGIMLVDWDTVVLAPPERDLWMVATGTGGELHRYTDLTGRPVDATARELHRLRWALDDLSCFVRDLRAPHRRTPGTEHAWDALQITIAQLTRPGPDRPASAGTTPR